MYKVNNRKGFTLVELLAVIVILAIIMIIAIPSVLDTMEVAKKKSLEEYAEKVKNVGEQKYLVQKEFEGLTAPGAADVYIYLYDVKDDLDLTNTGNYKGLFVMFKFSGSFFEKAKVKDEAEIEIEPNKPYFGVILEDDAYLLMYMSQTNNNLDEAAIVSLDEMREILLSPTESGESNMSLEMVDKYMNMFASKQGFIDYFKLSIDTLKEELSEAGLTLAEYESTIPDNISLRFMIVDGSTNEVIFSSKLFSVEMACECEMNPTGSPEEEH